MRRLFDAVPTLATRPSLRIVSSTTSPVDFLEQTRVLLVPYIEEASGRVAIEGLMAGVPTICARRAGLLEVAGTTAKLLDIPERFTPAHDEVPSARDVEEWVRTVIAEWDAPDDVRSAWAVRARKDAAERFTVAALAPSYESALESAVRAKSRPS